jgi:hypothetical protein
MDRMNKVKIKQESMIVRFRLNINYEMSNL